MKTKEAGKAPAARTADAADFTIAVACGLSLTCMVLFLAVVPFLHHLVGTRDFVVYWATGQQLLHHQNPYDAVAMGQLEHAAGFTGKGSFYMRNPPWSLPLTLPLGLLSARAAALPWSLALLALLIVAIAVFWKTTARPERRSLEWLAYCFPPALNCVMAGQTAIFLLLGLVLFLRLHRNRPFLAGAALWLCTLKPHIFVSWALVLLVWIVVTRSYRILAGGAAAMALSCLLTAWIDPAAWSQYLHWAGRSGIGGESIPCLSNALSKFVHPAVPGMVFVPCALGCLWAVTYFWPRRNTWDWMEQGGLVLLVSLVVAPYCWIWDQAIAIPALFFAADRTRSRKSLAMLGALCIALVLQPFIFSLKLTSAWYLWPAPTWLVWYLWARSSAHSVSSAAETSPLEAPALG